MYRLNQDGVFHQARGVEIIPGEPDKCWFRTPDRTSYVPGQRDVYLIVHIEEAEIAPNPGEEAFLLDGDGVKLAEFLVKELRPEWDGWWVLGKVMQPSAPWIREQLRQVEERR